MSRGGSEPPRRSVDQIPPTQADTGTAGTINTQTGPAAAQSTVMAADGPRIGGKRAKENSQYQDGENPNTRRRDGGGLTM